MKMLRVGIIDLGGAVGLGEVLSQMKTPDNVELVEVTSLSEIDDIDIVVVDRELVLDKGIVDVEVKCKRIMQELLNVDTIQFNPLFMEPDEREFISLEHRLSKMNEKATYHTMADKTYYKRNEFLLAKKARKQSRKIKSGRRLARSRP